MVLALVGVMAGLVLFIAFNWSISGGRLFSPVPDAGLPFALRLEALGHALAYVIALSVVLLGVPIFSLALLVVFARSQTRKWMAPLAVLAAFHILAYSMFRFLGVSLGPRYCFELVPVLMVLSASGLISLPTLLSPRFEASIRELSHGVFKIVLVSVVISLVGCLLPRLRVYEERGRYYDIRSLVEANVPAPALVLIKSEPGLQRLYIRPGFSSTTSTWQADGRLVDSASRISWSSAPSIPIETFIFSMLGVAASKSFPQSREPPLRSPRGSRVPPCFERAVRPQDVLKGLFSARDRSGGKHTEHGDTAGCR